VYLTAGATASRFRGSRSGSARLCFGRFRLNEEASAAARGCPARPLRLMPCGRRARRHFGHTLGGGGHRLALRTTPAHRSCSLQRVRAWPRRRSMTRPVAHWRGGSRQPHAAMHRGAPARARLVGRPRSGSQCAEAMRSARRPQDMPRAGSWRLGDWRLHTVHAPRQRPTARGAPVAPQRSVTTPPEDGEPPERSGASRSAIETNRREQAAMVGALGERSSRSHRARDGRSPARPCGPPWPAHHVTRGQLVDELRSGAVAQQRAMPRSASDSNGRGIAG